MATATSWSWGTSWIAHVETDLGEFDGAQNTARLSSAPVPAALPALSGNALRVEVPDDAYANGGIRAEVLLRTEPNLESEGTVTRYAWSTMLDADYPRRPIVTGTTKPPYQVIAQWHATANDWYGDEKSPPVAIIIRNGAFLLDRYHVVPGTPTPADPDPDPVFEELGATHIADITLGTWHHFEVTTRWSPVADGWVSVLHWTTPDNVTMTTHTGRTLYPAKTPPSRTACTSRPAYTAARVRIPRHRRSRQHYRPGTRIPRRPR